jgi:hypothetical protein
LFPDNYLSYTLYILSNPIIGYLFDNSSSKPLLVHLCSLSLFSFFLRNAFLFPSELALVFLLLGQGAAQQILMSVLVTVTLQGLHGETNRYGEVRAYGQAGNALAAFFMGFFIFKN